MEKSNMGPKFKQIKEDIVDDILSGVYEPGDMIPSQSNYANKYNVSRLTVRKAIDDLVDKGILKPEKGKGTYVQEIATKTYSYRRLAGFSSNVISNKVEMTSKVVNIGETRADKRLATHLQINEQSQVIVIERQRYINGICVSFQKSFLAKERVEDIDFIAEDLNHNSLYEVLKTKACITLSYVDECFRAIRCSSLMSSYFKVEEGDPLLYIVRITYSSDNIPIEYCQNYESSDVNGVWVKSTSI